MIRNILITKKLKRMTKNEQGERAITDYILLSNQQLLAMNKPGGMAVQSDKTEDMSLHQLAEIYCKHPVKVVHRIDRPSSGVVVFAKNKKAAMELSKQWKEGVVSKYYLAVVKKGQLREGLWEDLLWHNTKNNKSYVVDHMDDGAKVAKMKVEKLGEIDRYQLLGIELITGRHHQVRAQLAHAGFPIKGDVKYGARRGHKDRSIRLHAYSLSFNHPVSGERVELKSTVPADGVWQAFDELLPEMGLLRAVE
jgi:23S rRNA pseudouridine1911/1915/1917 synthase